jgi:hypothetical protein
MAGYKEKRISEIKPTDEKVCIICKVLSSRGNVLLVEDESGRAEILSEQAIEPKKMIKVFCSNIDGKLKVDFTQNLNGFDLNLYKKIKELYQKAGL